MGPRRKESKSKVKGNSASVAVLGGWRAEERLCQGWWRLVDVIGQVRTLDFICRSWGTNETFSLGECYGRSCVFKIPAASVRRTEEGNPSGIRVISWKALQAPPGGGRWWWLNSSDAGDSAVEVEPIFQKKF